MSVHLNSGVKKGHEVGAIQNSLLLHSYLYYPVQRNMSRVRVEARCDRAHVVSERTSVEHDLFAFPPFKKNKKTEID
jgi:hypothetical protein